MLYSVTGTVRKLTLPQAVVEVAGVGYLVTLPHSVWDALQEGAESTLILYTYVREDRLDLFGFLAKEDRMIFAEFLNLSGIGPKTALELCSLPRNILLLAAKNDDVSILTKVKGIGRKTAEKLLVDLKQLVEKHPEWSTAVTSRDFAETGASYDDDAIAALATLGYDRVTILETLKKLPKDLKKTEERVTAALRNL